VEVSPGEIISVPSGAPVYLSALLYDANNQPVYSGVTYTWSMSSPGVGDVQPNGNLATFTPSTTPGIGNLIVSAFNSTTTAEHTVRIYNGVPKPTDPPVSTTPSPLQTNQAAVFDGTTTYIHVSNSVNFHPQLGFTAEAWIKPNVPTFTSSIFNKSSNSQNSFQLLVTSEPQTASPDSNYSITYEFRVANSSSSCTYRTISQQKNIPANEVMSWQHLAGVIQPNGSLDIFVNGLKSTSSFNSVSGTCQLGYPITIGARNLQGVLDGVFPGAMDEVRISSVARYSENFTPSVTPLTPDTNTTILYHLDGDYSDSGGQGNFGQNSGNFSFIPSTISLPSPTPEPTVTPEPTAVPTPEPTASPEPTLVPSPTPKPTPIPQTTTIDVYAAGTKVLGVYPTMVLRIGNRVVARWANVRGNANKAQYQKFTYTRPSLLPPNPKIRVEFTNDRYIPGLGDRNLRVDKIVVNGSEYQSESPTTYGQGARTPKGGCGNGNLQTEWLFCNGHFLYSTP